MMAITVNFLAVALGGIFDRGFKPLTSDLVVTYPFTTSTNTDPDGESEAACCDGDIRQGCGEALAGS